MLLHTNINWKAALNWQIFENLPNTSEPQWLEHLCDHRNLFDMGSSGHFELTIAPGHETNSDNLESLLDLLYNNGMLSLLIRIASMRRF